MSETTHTPSSLDPAAVADFHAALLKAKRIVAVIGAGLSVASGLPTYRGVGGLWLSHDVNEITGAAAFRRDPGLVWQFHHSRRHMALAASPNNGHHALVELARERPGFIALTQNVDNLSARAGHPADQLKELHGNLFTLRCTDVLNCGYVEHDNYVEPLTPALDMTDEQIAAAATAPDSRPKANIGLIEGLARKNKQILGDKYQEKEAARTDFAPLGSDPTGPLPDIPRPSGITKKDLPQCPKCKTNILRPGVIWFGEPLAKDLVEEVDAIFAAPEPIDLCIVIGTSSTVWPAAGYSELARKKGARVAVVNMDVADAKWIRPGTDWVFIGDAATVIPELLQPVAGDVK
jgi:NAD-dependent deacetylase sirtuin 5